MILSDTPPVRVTTDAKRAGTSHTLEHAPGVRGQYVGPGSPRVRARQGRGISMMQPHRVPMEPELPESDVVRDVRDQKRPVDFSVVVPCYNEEASIPHLLEILVPVLDREVGSSWEIVFVNDGSRDRTMDLILEANNRDPRIKGVALSRNFGHQAAVSCGLAFVSGRIVGLLDCDLQDSPEVLVQLFRKVRDEGYDVGYAVRRRREGSWFRKACYRIFYRIMSGLSEHPFPEDAGDFSVFNRRVHQTIMALPETVRVLRGLRSWVGFRQCEIAVDRPERKHGSTKYTFLRLVSLALSSLTGFSYAPLRMASLMGLGMGVFSLILAGLFILNRVLPNFTVLSYYIGSNPGVTTIILYLSLVSSMLFFCLGVMGEYLVVMLKEVKGRPAAIAQTVIGDLTHQAHSSVVACPAGDTLHSLGA